MKVLILYYLMDGIDRNTIYEHLYSFKKYSKAECFYVNTLYHTPDVLIHIDFDLVIYHYTFLSMKWNGPKYFRNFLKAHQKLKQLKGYKIAIPQDEYVYSDEICKFFKEFKIKTVFTCLEESEWGKVYPKRKSNLDKYVTVYTGYVDSASIDKIEKFYKDHKKRKYDIGYRARKLPFWLGNQSLKKWKLTEQFLKMLSKSKLRYSLSNKYKDVFFGDDWYKFLADCRVVLGCEGGASIHDPYGKIRAKVEKYTKLHPLASFKEVEKNCFQGIDGNLKLFSLSPRHFEACMTRTCQALVDGGYSGIFKPNIHYIEIKADWSNIKQVIRKISDKEYCNQIAQNAYKDIIVSGNYTYKSFVDTIFLPVKRKRNTRKSLISNLSQLGYLIDYFLFYRVLTMYQFIKKIRSYWRLIFYERKDVQGAAVYNNNEYVQSASKIVYSLKKKASKFKKRLSDTYGLVAIEE